MAKGPLCHLKRLTRGRPQGYLGKGNIYPDLCFRKNTWLRGTSLEAGAEPSLVDRCKSFSEGLVWSANWTEAEDSQNV